jgi:hypothetical protein
MSNVNEILAERGSRYGVFSEHARVTQGIKDRMRDSKNWKFLEDDMKESLEMLAHKMGRILNGDPDYADSWVDIAGYSQLIVNRLEDEAGLKAGRCALEVKLAEAMLADAARHA